MVAYHESHKHYRHVVGRSEDFEDVHLLGHVVAAAAAVVGVVELGVAAVEFAAVEFAAVGIVVGVAALAEQGGQREVEEQE